MIAPRIQVFPLGDVIMQGSPEESPDYILNGRVLVNVVVPANIKEILIEFKSCTNNTFMDRFKSKGAASVTEPQLTIREIIYAGDEHVWGRGVYEFFFQLAVPGSVPETVFTDRRKVTYKVTGCIRARGMGANRAVQSIAVKRIPYFGSIWESITSDVVDVTAVWRERIELSLQGCNRVQKDDQRIQVRGVVRALEKGFRLKRVGVILEERIRSRENGDMWATIVASNFLSEADAQHASRLDAPIIEELAFDIGLDIPKAYKKIHYDVKFGPISVSHRLAFVVTIIDCLDRGTNLRLFTPLHVLPKDVATVSADALPSYKQALGDRVLLASSGRQCCIEYDHSIEHAA